MNSVQSVAFDTSTLTEEVYSSIVKFSNGRLRTDQKDIHFVMSSHKSKDNNRLKKRKILVAESDKLSYTGNNFGKDLEKLRKNTVTILGVLDKNTGKMRLYNTEWFSLTPTLANSGDQLEHLNEDSDRVTKKDNLSLTFGSAAKRRVVESRMKHTVETEALANLTEKTVTEEHIQEASLKLAEQVEDNSNPFADILPPMDRNADKVSDVFDINDIVAENDVSTLDEKAIELFGDAMKNVDEWKKEHEKYPEYFVNHLYITKKELSNKGKYLVFYLCLCSILEKHSKNNLTNGIPESLTQNVKNRFQMSILSQRTRAKNARLTPRMKDKLYLHLILLALYIDNYEVVIDPIIKDLGTNITKLRNLVQLIGARINENGNERKLTLSLPLAEINKRTTKQRKN